MTLSKQPHLPVIAVLLLVLCACDNSNKHYKVGKYVYVDKHVTIHVDRKCAAQSAHNPIADAVKIGEGIIFVDTCRLTYRFHNEIGSRSYMFCPNCIDDNTFQHLVAIMDRSGLSADTAVTECNDLDLSTTPTTGGWASGLKL